MIEINRIYNEDCLEGMKRIDTGSIDMILCDLPYGTTACKWDSVIPFSKLWAHYERIIKDDGAIALFSTQPFTTNLIASNMRLFKYEIIWQKNMFSNFFSVKERPGKVHENICIFYKKQPCYNPQMEEGKPYKINIRSSRPNKGIYNGPFAAQDREPNKGTRYPVSVLNFKKEKGFHPTQKPVALNEWLIRTYTNEGDLVLDNCMGSGATAIACINTGRQFVGFETDPEFYQKSVEWIKKHKEETKEKAPCA